MGGEAEHLAFIRAAGQGSGITADPRVCVVIVTYNRKQLLAGCLEAVLAQTYPVARILVVDNASTDGTLTFLEERGYLARSEIDYVVLPENGGGAAGFHEGFKRALHTDADWIWAMDDDGLPASECLDRLMNASPAAGQFRGPVVLAREEMSNPENDRLAFAGAADTPQGRVLLASRSDVEENARDGVLPGYACVFNGVLIHRDAASRIGLPKKEFFIWGDEWDYVFRAEKLGIGMSTVAGALYWHPMNRTEFAKLRVGWLEYDVPYADPGLRSYLLIRNHAYLASRYRGLIAWVRHTIKYLLYHRTPDGCFGSWQVLRFSIEGLIGRFSGPGAFQKPN